MVDPIILALRRLRQGNLEFKAVKGDSYLKRKTKVKNNIGNMEVLNGGQSLAGSMQRRNHHHLLWALL